MCCGTKRLTEIKCPADCPYLASAREHPPAAAIRQHQRDIASVVHGLRDLNERQSQLFLAVSTFIARYQPPDLQPLHDDDIVEAAAALAATFETASCGLIYEHRPASPPAERLAASLRPLLVEAGKGGGSAFEREAASILRRVEESARDMRAREPENRRAYRDLLDRVLRRSDDPERQDSIEPEAPRLIVP